MFPSTRETDVRFQSTLSVAASKSLISLISAVFMTLCALVFPERLLQPVRRSHGNHLSISIYRLNEMIISHMREILSIHFTTAVNNPQCSRIARKSILRYVFEGDRRIFLSAILPPPLSAISAIYPSNNHYFLLK